MKINILDLEFSNDHFYIQSNSIVEKVTFNNRTFYSKFKKVTTEISPLLLEQHYNNELTLAISLVENNLVNYIVIEYHQEDWSTFYSLLKYLFKSLDIFDYMPYQNFNQNIFQIFIPKSKISLENAYIEVESIKHLLELKSKKSYKIYPNNFLPINQNIITLPTKKL